MKSIRPTTPSKSVNFHRGRPGICKFHWVGFILGCTKICTIQFYVPGEPWGMGTATSEGCARRSRGQGPKPSKHFRLTNSKGRTARIWRLLFGWFASDSSRSKVFPSTGLAKSCLCQDQQIKNCQAFYGKSHLPNQLKQGIFGIFRDDRPIMVDLAMEQFPNFSRLTQHTSGFFIVAT